MGVPGDMNLELLDYIKDVDGLRWIGNANELNAAYAADGYSRIKGCPGVLVTTFGVGELSALNGIAGAYTEQVKVIHVVGTTSTTAQKNRLMIHHCLGPSPDHKVRVTPNHHVRAAHCWLDNPETAASEIDVGIPTHRTLTPANHHLHQRVFRECYVHSLPVYIFVPSDFVHVPVSGSISPLANLALISDHENETAAIAATISTIYAAKSPVVIVDALVSRHLAIDVTRELVDFLGFPTFSTSMGKSIIDETRPYFHGIYNGQVSVPDVCKVIEQDSDLVIDLGPLLSDSNTGGHTRKIAESKLITVLPNHVSIGNKTYQEVGLASFLSALLRSIDKSRLPRPSAPLIRELPPPRDVDAEHVTQSWVWKRLGLFVRPGDVLIAESGTAQFGLPDAQLPEGITYITQVYYGSIGYTVPACLGAALARQDLDQSGRIILVVGDGSLQLTVQEVGTMIKLGLHNIIIMVINNDGYTIERAIHGPEEAYNDIATWNHMGMLDFFGARDGQANSRAVRTKKEFDEIVSLTEYTNPKTIQVLEVFMEKMDLPWRLESQIAIINERIAQTSKARG
ncbi:related to pyruvate decarboxylase [Phialocephala subalpina]|uniref:Pyruvate decarboxylase n=1 Tax=Phialocephala subalpina TaxID=576137 RepID=A0A1L7XUQ6_9HELO|nr:related to pyruvate decarboxylase [Phialocephala subalpina]